MPHRSGEGDPEEGGAGNDQQGDRPPALHLQAHRGHPPQEHHPEAEAAQNAGLDGSGEVG